MSNHPLTSATLSTRLGRHASWRSVWVLLRYRLWTMLHGRSLYVVAIAVLVLVAAMINDFLVSIASAGLSVGQEPFRPSLTIALNLAAIYLALSAMIVISRECEQGTLLVLFFGPISHWGYLISWLVAQVISYLLFCLLLGGGLVGILMISGLGFSTTLFLLLVFSIPATASVIAFGILIASLGRETRGSILIFLGITLVLVGLEALNSFFASLGPKQLSEVLLPLSRTIALLNAVLTRISPYSYLPRGLDAISAHDWVSYCLWSAGALVYAAAVLLLAKFSFRWRGACP